MPDSNFREVRRVTNLLLKIKRYERKMAAEEGRNKKQGLVSHDMSENKGVIG
jgi:hypothetical protein